MSAGEPEGDQRRTKPHCVGRKSGEDVRWVPIPSRLTRRSRRVQNGGWRESFGLAGTRRARRDLRHRQRELFFVRARPRVPALRAFTRG